MTDAANPRPAFFVRARFARFRDALAAQREVESLPVTRTRFRRWLNRHSPGMPPDIHYAASVLLVLLDNEATTRKRAEHSFHVEQVATQRAALERLLLANVNHRSEQERMS